MHAKVSFKNVPGDTFFFSRDEAHLNGSINKQSVHYWATAIRESSIRNQYIQEQSLFDVRFLQLGLLAHNISMKMTNQSIQTVTLSCSEIPFTHD